MVTATEEYGGDMTADYAFEAFECRAVVEEAGIVGPETAVMVLIVDTQAMEHHIVCD